MRYSKAIGTSLFIVFALAITSTLALAVDVPKWSTYDINLTANGSSSNWYTDANAAVTATFTGPGGITQTVSGFWNGNNAFDIRFTPTVEGTWTYTTSSLNSGLNNQTGTINALAATAGNRGFLRVDPTYTNSFAWDDGSRCFLWGQTYYFAAAAGLTNDNWKTAINNVASHGINKAIIEVYGDLLNADWNHGYADVEPYVDTSGNHLSPDRDQLNFSTYNGSTYWQKLDQVVQYLGSKGMVAELVIFDNNNNNRAYGTSSQNDRFVNYVVNRYAAYHNVIWNLEYEWEYSANYSNPQYKSDYNRFGGIVRNYDPWMGDGTTSAPLRPLSVHQRTRIDFDFFGSTWPTNAIIQYGPRNSDGYTNADEWGNAGIVYNLGHNMPVVNDEYAYLGEVNSGKTVTSAMTRNAAWGIATAGGYGSAADWRQFTDGSTKYRPSATCDWVDTPQYDDIQHLVDFFTTKGIEYWKMSSQNSLTPNSRTYVLAETGRQYVAYAATGGTFTMDLAAGTYYAYEYNPRTGETTPLADVTGGGTRTFSMPDSTNDWVLHLSTFQEVPEPTSVVLLGIALLSIVTYCGRRRFNKLSGDA